MLQFERQGPAVIGDILIFFYVIIIIIIIKVKIWTKVKILKCTMYSSFFVKVFFIFIYIFY